ncbi:hypothetical protein BKK79_37415 (plasmid) [Cupriavidus sp. USMAA2-4]|uniref:SOS response-associated peptidase family protein n=1 Tax=Cupriavidus sp. USMAA2-4 TaxID=876364 RepID=UPI0008A6C12F|nr:SOS response-associated peptidase family protein [Cupriavidus sp. USMAA2-4]AOY97614.1 hypothetical protein BKK79_37415 [Cupriavidus sp. USMAA2-4]
MCYSALVRMEHRRLEREYGARASLQRYLDLFQAKSEGGGWRQIPKAMRAAFASPISDEEAPIASVIAAAEQQLAREIEAELFQQKTRLANAERVLASKATKKAESDQRIARDKIERAQRNLADLARTDLAERDSRIFPGIYASVIIEHGGERLVVPMRYGCRLPGWTEAIERKYPGTYNARSDRLEESWGKLFGRRHGVVVVTRFYENVALHRSEGRDLRPGEQQQNVVLEFAPQPAFDMLVACLWNISKTESGDLLSFAAITDEPPPEVAAAGHDRCVIPLKANNLDAWLAGGSGDLAAMHALLRDRAPTWFEHRLAA